MRAAKREPATAGSAPPRGVPGLTAAPCTQPPPQRRQPCLSWGRLPRARESKGHSLLVMQCSAGRRRFLRRPCSTERTDGRCTSCSTKRWDCNRRMRSAGRGPGRRYRRPVLLLWPMHRQATCCPSPGSPGDQAHTYLESSLCVCTNHGLSVETQLSERPLKVPCLQHPPLPTLVQVGTSQNCVGAAPPLPPPTRADQCCAAKCTPPLLVLDPEPAGT